jgi:hypothetical protein
MLLSEKVKKMKIKKDIYMKKNILKAKEKVDELMERLAQEPKVRVKNPKLVRRYLYKFNDMIDVVPKAVNAAKRHFPKAQLVLDLYEDPEIEDRYLVLYVRLWSYDESVMERVREARTELKSFIDRLEETEKEFLHHLVERRGWLQLTTDFQKPEE